MTIMQGGRDVTQEVLAKAESLRIANLYDFADVINHLKAARLRLDAQPRPWLDDIIYDSMHDIDGLIERLLKKTKSKT